MLIAGDEETSVEVKVEVGILVVCVNVGLLHNDGHVGQVESKKG